MADWTQILFTGYRQEKDITENMQPTKKTSENKKAKI